MASQVFSGSGNFTYTNNTGQNVRVVINYMSATSTSFQASNPLTIRWAGLSVVAYNLVAIGRNLAFSVGIDANAGAPISIAANNMATGLFAENSNAALPTEIMLAPGQVFSATCGIYNVVVIPEEG